MLGVAAALMCLAGGPTGPWADVPPEEQLARIEAAAGGNRELLMVPGQSVGPIIIGITDEEVVAALGEPQLYLGDAWQYSLLGFAVTFKEGVVQAVIGGAGSSSAMALVKAFKGRTVEGVGMGSSRSKVVAVFGEPDRAYPLYDGGETLWYRRLGIVFSLTEAAVYHVAIFNPFP